MAINYPVSLDNFSNSPVANGETIPSTDKNELDEAVDALQAKVGIDNSATATSHDYLLTHLPAQAVNWDAGAVEVTALKFKSDVATGTAPIAVDSTTVCTKLNADTVDGTHLAGLQTVLTNSAGLAAAVNDETGTGVVVFNNAPTLIAPVLGEATATKINGLTIDTTTGTLDITNAKTLTVTGDATISATPYTPGGTDVAVADGGTGSGTAAGARSNLGAAASGANSDITSITGLSTALATNQGGTGSTANANAASGVVVLNASSQLPAVSGALLTNLPSSTDVQTFTSSGTWTKPTSGTYAMIYLWGAGGSGGKGTGISPNGAGGGGGGCAYAVIPLASLSATVTVTLGEGGAARTTNTSGLVGGNSTFGSYLTAYGGGGGYANSSSTTGGGGGGGGMFSVGLVGSSTLGGNGGRPVGGVGVASSYADSSSGGASGGQNGSIGGFSHFGGGGGGGATSGDGGNSIFGGGGGGGATAGAGGNSVYGGSGGAGATGTDNGGTGTQPGGGGGGSKGGNSGAGGKGQCIVIVV